VKCLGTEQAADWTDRTSDLSQRRFRLLQNNQVGSGSHPDTCAVGAGVDALIIRLRLSGGVPLLAICASMARTGQLFRRVPKTAKSDC